MKIDESLEEDYESVKISNLGYVDPYGNEGLLELFASLYAQLDIQLFLAYNLARRSMV